MGSEMCIRDRYYREGKVHLSAVPLVDYSQDEEWDSDQMNFQISSNERPVNHLICLGKGDLSERMVRHLYMDVRGNISETQTFFGVDEVTETYDYSNVESEEELITGGTQRLQETWAAANTLETDFENNTEYDVCLLYTSPSPRDGLLSRMPSSA